VVVVKTSCRFYKLTLFVINVHTSPYHALSMGMTQQFFVFFVPGDLDLWPWHSNSGEIFAHCT